MSAFVNTTDPDHTAVPSGLIGELKVSLIWTKFIQCLRVNEVSDSIPGDLFNSSLVLIQVLLDKLIYSPEDDDACK